jgi:hypothetical protein
MELIETVTVGSGGQASITFASIAADWTDLYLVMSLRNNRAATAAEQKIFFNGNTTNFTARYLGGEGNTAASASVSGRGFTGVENGNNSTANTFSNQAIYIPNYASSNAKSFSSDSINENNSTDANRYIVAGLWSTTDPITSITLNSGFPYLEHSTASLYGILAGSDGTTTVS